MKKSVFLLVLIVLVSCQKDLMEFSENIKEEQVSEVSPYSISIDSALAYLADFVADEDVPDVKSSDKRTVGSFIPVKYNLLRTRASQNMDCENLMYVVNFEQDNGYAILAADKRIEEKVIAIVDDGNIQEETIYSAIEHLNEERRYVWDEYPMTGPGFFTTPETGDELFINPNTVSLYDEDKQDTLVGNFMPDGVGGEYVAVDTATQKSEMVSPPELVATSLCLSYVADKIENFDGREDTGKGGNREFVDDFIGDHSGDRVEAKTSESDWSTVKIVGPILADFVKWGQDDPFNYLYPEKRKYLLFGDKDKAPAGCFPLAIAKILAHFEYPNRYTFNGFTIDWKELKRSYETTIGRMSAASLLYGISSGCNSLYFYAGTFTFPSEAESYMSFIGLHNVNRYKYSFDRVTQMIDNGCPLVIYSVPNIDITRSHSWNIDGYKVKERTITTKKYRNGVLEKTYTRTETRNMVHCDFGWKGSCNGYYLSGIFRLNDPSSELDSGNTSKKTTHYNNLLRVLTYDRP